MATSNYLAVQWFGLQAFSASGPGSVPVGGTKIPQVIRCKKERKKENGNGLHRVQKSLCPI